VIIGEMPLYATIERFRNELRRRRLGTSSPLAPDKFFRSTRFIGRGRRSVAITLLLLAVATLVAYARRPSALEWGPILWILDPRLE
jgi:hypothetical protein